MSIFKGSGVALVTPFMPNGEIDYEQLRKLTDFHVEHKTDAIIVCGTSGESATMTVEEHLECIAVVAEQANGRIPVVAGTGSNDTATAIELSTEAEKCGVDGLLMVTPYYNKCTQNGLIKHYEKVSEAVKTPIILYNVPSRTGCNILPATAVKMAKELENVVAIKEASGNISQVAELAHLADGCIDIYSGNDDQIVPLLSLGGIGVISVTANIIPDDTHDLCQKFFDGDVKGSLELQLKAIDLCKALFCEVNPIPVKKATELMGMTNGVVRLPLTEMEPENTAKLEKAMRDYGISF
ncbi:4-hydroxy-tetrahydrodipicolinate synthase [Lachnospiraceae bacterium NE2001]|nr:4-hydroxy-tetrahydrodipicolinate synthase [Lachnospiraceae bacterium NE2001]